MVERIVFLPAASRDLEEAYRWYEGRSPGLGQEFTRSVDACLHNIRRNPELHEVVFKQYRQAMVRRFPYAVFYKLADRVVTVYSVFHCSQNPAKLRSRLLTPIRHRIAKKHRKSVNGVTSYNEN
jgi:plasmid stabilization system protein ParE